MTDIYFLGGRDLEMLEIATLLHEASACFNDKRLAWGARLSDYRLEIEGASARGETPVAVELTEDMPAAWMAAHGVIAIDHHGKRAGHEVPTSLEQVFFRLGLPQSQWTRRRALIAINDRAHVAGMAAFGATREEIIAIRAGDRAAQGVSEADETEAVRAIAARRIEGRLTHITTPSNTSSAIADRILPELGGPGYDRLLVEMPNKLAAFGDGEIITALAEAVPGSWWGGDLPARGFWGAAANNIEQERDRLLPFFV